MELLTLLTIAGFLYVIVSIIISLIMIRFFYKEYKKTEQRYTIHVEKMEEMRKEFEKKQKENKNKMNRFR